MYITNIHRLFIRIYICDYSKEPQTVVTIIRVTQYTLFTIVYVC